MRRRLFDYSRVPPRRRALILAAMLFWSILTAWGLHRFVAQFPIIIGQSMAPTFQHGDRNILWLGAYRRHPPTRGDVVAVASPRRGQSVKRVIALPGEIVQIRDNRVWINDALLEEAYLPVDTPTPSGPLARHRYEVAPDCYFVLGDNRLNSVDSRHFGAVPRNAIRGRLLWNPSRE